MLVQHQEVLWEDANKESKELRVYVSMSTGAQSAVLFLARVSCGPSARQRMTFGETFTGMTALATKDRWNPEHSGFAFFHTASNECHEE